MRIVVASTLAVLATAAAINPALTQPRNVLTECGGRPPIRYAAVFDASSSVRDKPALRDQTEASYRKLLGLFAGLLCRGDTLEVYTFPAGRTTRMDPLVEITSASRAPSHLSATARRVIEAHSSHTDLHLVTRGIVRDLLASEPPDAVFLVTDGSYYPFGPTPDDRTLDRVHDSLTELAGFVTQTMQGDTSRVFVIGVNAANSYAVDRQLGLALPASSEDRRWEGVDLFEGHGEDLLRVLFKTRYIALSELSLWKVLLEPPHSLWARRLDYLTHRELPWDEVRSLAVRHLVYVPGGPGGSTSCPPLAGDDTTASVEKAGYTVAGSVLCSLNDPTPAQLAAIREPPKYYALRQDTSLWPAAGTRHVRGLNDLLFRGSASECGTGSLRSHFASGGRWPLPDTTPVGKLHISHTDKVAWMDSMPLIRLGGTGCVVPLFTSGAWPRPPGRYLVKVTHEKTAVFRLTVDTARIEVVDAFIRPGGLPFPSDRIALVRVCVRTRRPLAGHERMWIRLEDKLLPVTHERAHRCDGAAPDVAAFSGLVGLEHTDRRSAEVFVASEGVRPESPRAGEWLAVSLKKDGKLLQSWLNLGGWFFAGMVLQLGYGRWANRRSPAGWVRRRATWSGAAMSGIIVAVVGQFVVVARETDVDSDRIPVILALSVLAHMAKLLAAALVPEHVEELMSPD